MNEQEAFEIVRHALKPRRFEHTERVVATAVQLAQKYGGNLSKIKLAAILHDYAKYRSPGEMRETVRVHSELPDKLLDYGDELLHAFAGAVYLRKEHGVTDPGVLKAVKYHTTGRSGMSLEEKIVFLADYIEPGRTFPQAREAAKAAERSLDEGCVISLKNTIQFLTEKHVPVYPDTFEAYNDLVISLRKTEGN